MQTIQRRKSSTYYGITKDVMNHYVFVYNLVSFVEEKHLLKAFQKFNPIRASVVPMKAGKAAFVCFGTPEQAADVLKEGTILNFRLFDKLLIVQPLYSRRSLRTICPHIKLPYFIPKPLDLHLSIIKVMKKVKSVPLPRECISMIASHLEYRDRANMEIISRIWRLGSLDSHTRTEVLDPNDKLWSERGDKSVKVTNEKIKWLVKRCGNKVITVKLDSGNSNKYLTPEVVGMIGEYCQNVQNLYVSDIELRADDILQMATNYRRLRSLSLRPWADESSTPDLDNALSTLFRNNVLLESFQMAGENCGSIGKCFLDMPTTLRHLDISAMEVDGKLLSMAIRQFQQLESLKVQKFHTYQPHILLALIENDALHSTLTTLRFFDCFFYCDLFFAGESGIAVLQCYTNLTTLQISCCDWVRAETILHIGTYMTQLTNLDISGCRSFYGKYALNPLANLTKLETLAMSGLDKNVKGSFLKFLSNLRRLECLDNSGVTDKNICDLLKHVHSLVYVNVAGCLRLTRKVANAIHELRKTSRKIPLDIYLYKTNLVPREEDKTKSIISMHYRPRNTSDHLGSDYSRYYSSHSFRPSDALIEIWLRMFLDVG